MGLECRNPCPFITIGVGFFVCVFCVLVGWFGLALLGAHQLRDVLLWVIQAV